MDDVQLARVSDPGRGDFCEVVTTKAGHSLALPHAPHAATKRRPSSGIHHQNKTAQDRLPIAERQRVKDWHKRQEAMKKAARHEG